MDLQVEKLLSNLFRRLGAASNQLDFLLSFIRINHLKLGVQKEWDGFSSELKIWWRNHCLSDFVEIILDLDFRSKFSPLTARWPEGKKNICIRPTVISYSLSLTYWRKLVNAQIVPRFTWRNSRRQSGEFFHFFVASWDDAIQMVFFHRGSWGPFQLHIYRLNFLIKVTFWIWCIYLPNQELKRTFSSWK